MHISICITIFQDFLERSGQIESLRILEKGTKLTATQLCDNMEFLRGLILDGDFTSAEEFVQPLRDIPNFNYKNVNSMKYNQVMFELKKQKLLEMLSDEELGISSLSTTGGRISLVVNELKVRYLFNFNRILRV